MDISVEDQQELEQLLARYNRAPCHEPWHGGSTERMKLFSDAIQIFKRYPMEVQQIAVKRFTDGIDMEEHELSLQDRIDYYNNVLNPSKRKYPNKRERESYTDWQMQQIMTQRKVPETLTAATWKELKSQWDMGAAGSQGHHRSYS